jgi:predicted DNA binding CopG/RHH family protein
MLCATCCLSFVRRESETIALKITPLELAAVKEKAGVAGLSTYIKHYIRTNTELFK